MKKKLCIFISAVLIFVSMPTIAFADDYSDATPVGDKYAFAAMAENPNGNYYLTDDIIFTANDFKYKGDFFNDGNYFKAIDTFRGTLDGCGHTVSGLKGDSAITKTNFGTVKNILLKNCTFSSGAICYENKYSISNCKLESSTSVKLTELNYGDIEYCFSNDNNCGICGTNYANISYCINNTDLTEGGGIANDNYGSISYCINNGDILSNSSEVGGICGSNTSPDYGETGSSASVNYCINNGQIKGERAVGGICGVTWYGSITNCLNTATVSATTGLSNIRGPQYWSSGISELQYNAKTICCINIGSVNSGNGAAVSLVRDYQTGSINEGFYLSNTGKVSDNTTSTAVSSSNLSNENSFPSLDFDNDWEISDSKPTLKFTKQKIIGASIYSQPIKLYYDIDESFDSSGLSVIVYDNLGNWENNEEYEVSGYTGKFGINKISVTAQGYNNKFNVFVQDKIENCTIEPLAPITVTGKAIEPIPNIISPRGDLLEYGKDFLLDYENNNNIGVAKIIIKGIGLYKGSAYTEFLITPEKRLEIVNVPDKYYYTYGDKVDATGLVVRKFTDDGLWHIIETYELSGYTGELGKNNITVSSDGFENQFEVFVQEYIYNTNIKLTKETLVSNGKQLAPAVIVTTDDKVYLEQGKDYTLSYNDNVYPGVARVTISGINNYKGSAVKTFIITPAQTTGLCAKDRKEQSIMLAWNKQAGVDGYCVEKYNEKTKKYSSYKTVTTNSLTVTALTPATNYKFRVRSYKVIDGKLYYGQYSSVLSTKTAAVKVSSTSISSVKAKTAAFTAKWKKQSSVNGYQLQYSTSSSFKSAKTLTISKNGSTTTTVKKLKGGKKYYVRIRCYRTVGGKKYYSSWSKKKTVKVKAKNKF